MNKCTNNKKTMVESQRNIVCKKNVRQNVESFKLLKGEISNYMIRKLSYEKLKNLYKNEGEAAVIALLPKMRIKKPLEVILNHLKTFP